MRGVGLEFSICVRRTERGKSDASDLLEGFLSSRLSCYEWNFYSCASPSVQTNTKIAQKQSVSLRVA